jgi:hypothetical protein
MLVAVLELALGVGHASSPPDDLAGLAHEVERVGPDDVAPGAAVHAVPATVARPYGVSPRAGVQSVSQRWSSVRTTTTLG